MAIVITGFGPFRDHKTNASWEAVRLIPGLWEDTQHPLTVEEIPVEYGWVQGQESARWEEAFFTVHVGVSSRDKVVTLECEAHNAGYCQPDTQGCVPLQGECVQGGLDRERTCLDMESLVQELTVTGDRIGVEFGLSVDPGHYLCDFVYYRSLHASKGRSLFVHVPPLGKPYTATQLAQAIVILVKTVIRNLEG